MAPELTELLVAAFRLVDAGEEQPAETIRIENKEFRVFAEQHVEHGMVLVLMQQPDRMPCDVTLRTQYGLTDREVDVARLLVERNSAREIADRLGIKESTASRHTERVMKKVGVGSRKEVRLKLRGLTAENI